MNSAESLVDEQIFSIGEALIPPDIMKRIRRVRTRSKIDSTSMYPPPEGKLKWEAGGFDEYTMKGTTMSGANPDDPTNTLYYSYMTLEDKSALVGYLFLPSARYSTVSIYLQGSDTEEGRGSRYQYVGNNDKTTRSTIKKMDRYMTVPELTRLGFQHVDARTNDMMTRMMQ